MEGADPQSSKKVNFQSRDIGKRTVAKQDTNYFVKTTPAKHPHKVFFTRRRAVFISSIILVLLAAGIVIFFFIFHPEKSATNPTTDYTETTATEKIAETSTVVNQYTAPTEKHNDQGEVVITPEQETAQQDLENIIADPDVASETHVDAIINLAELYFNQERYELAASTIDQALAQNQFSDAERYRLLSVQHHIYRDSNNKEGRIATIRRILELPDNLTLPTEDWQIVKNYYQNLLQELTNA